MSGSTTTWEGWKEIPAVVLAPCHLRRTTTLALVVGSAFFSMNQLSTVLSGHATDLIWLKVVVTYVTPLCVSNFGLLSATRRRSPIDAQP